MFKPTIDHFKDEIQESFTNEDSYNNCSDCNLLNSFQPCEACHNSIAQASQFTPKY